MVNLLQLWSSSLAIHLIEIRLQSPKIYRCRKIYSVLWNPFYFVRIPFYIFQTSISSVFIYWNSSYFSERSSFLMMSVKPQVFFLARIYMFPINFMVTEFAKQHTPDTEKSLGNCLALYFEVTRPNQRSSVSWQQNFSRITWTVFTMILHVWVQIPFWICTHFESVCIIIMLWSCYDSGYKHALIWKLIIIICRRTPAEAKLQQLNKVKHFRKRWKQELFLCLEATEIIQASCQSG